MQFSQRLFKDARDLQILWLGTFLSYGLLFLNWHMNLMLYANILFGALATQGIFIQVKKLPWHGIKSALITGLGMCLFLKVNHPIIGLLASTMAVGSKFFIRYGDKHVFNPANFGLIAAIVLTGEAWISPGQWGNESITLLLIAVCGLVVTTKVGRLDAGVAFLGTLLILEFIRSVFYQGWPLDHLVHSFSNGTLILFSFFMLTDPMTSPNDRKARMVWAVLLAATAFALSNFMQLYTAPVWALFVWCALTPIFDKLFIKPKFNWI